jgi:recombinational DNA repair protein RecR
MNKIKINQSLNNIVAQLDKMPVVGVVSCQRVAIIANEVQLLREYINASTEAPEKKEDGTNDTDNIDDSCK